MEKIKILVCDDDASFLAWIITTTKILTEKVDMVVTTSLGGLIGTAAQGKSFTAIFLDGYLANGETTIPFLEKLSDEKFPHLRETFFYLTSSERGITKAQLEFLTDEDGEDKWKWATCRKEAIAAEIRRLAALD